MIRNKAVVNEDTSGNVLQLQAEIKRLREALEKYKAGLVSRPSSPRLGMSLLSSPAGFAVRSDDEKTIQELRDMLSTSMAIREKTEGEKMVMGSGGWVYPHDILLTDLFFPL